MNIRNISANQIVVWTALVLGLVMALVIGNAVGSSDMRLVAGLVAAIPVAVIFVKLKTSIWVLLPIGWYLTGRLPWLPLPFSVRDLCFMAVIFFFTLFFATRTLPWSRKLGLLDYLLYINLAYLVTVFARNPVGFWALQSSMVGGRPYFEIALAFGAFVILSHVRVTDFIAKIFPWLFIAPSAAVAALDTVVRLFPQYAYAAAMIYSGAGSMPLSQSTQEGRIGEDRIVGFKDLGLVGVLSLCSRYNPITLISPLFPLRTCLFGIALVLLLFSGFRSYLLTSLVFFVLAIVVQGRVRDLWLAAAAGILGLMLLINLQGNVLELPRTMQRALSWLPGNWNPEVLNDAEGSSQWRFEMWQWAWNDERILRDRVWGQGFGLSIDDMSLIASSLIAGQTADSRLGGSDRESFLITGALHSGPLSTIKYIGIVGLILYYTLMCYMAFVAWRLCKSARGTKAFPLALFVGLPIIYEPFNFVVIFGALDSGYPQLLFWAGLLNMTQGYMESLKLAGQRESTSRCEAITQPAREIQPVLSRQPIIRRSP